MQKNILTYLSQLSKHPGTEGLDETYKYLCELTHPNWLGNRPFYRISQDGSLTTVSSEYDEGWCRSTALLLDGVASWSAQATLNVLGQMQHAIRHVRDSLGAA